MLEQWQALSNNMGGGDLIIIGGIISSKNWLVPVLLSTHR